MSDIVGGAISKSGMVENVEVAIEVSFVVSKHAGRPSPQTARMRTFPPLSSSVLYIITIGHGAMTLPPLAAFPLNPDLGSGDVTTGKILQNMPVRSLNCLTMQDIPSFVPSNFTGYPKSKYELRILTLRWQVRITVRGNNCMVHSG